jgi:hypothetical protein
MSPAAIVLLLSMPLRLKTENRRITAAPALHSLLPLPELRPREAAVIDKLPMPMSDPAHILQSKAVFCRTGEQDCNMWVGPDTGKGIQLWMRLQHTSSS